MNPLWKRLALILAVLSLAGPAYVPGIELYELYTEGTTADYGEFCDDVEHPPFLLGAATTCDLSLRQVALFAAFSYGIGALMLFPVALFVAGGFSGLRRKSAK
ncbi:hypothetical protein [Ferrovibrio terrae]|uniref:hypothetical protein n=1 Tax=Ferrovibrio terrae TaxID=2594003 RepID=UPI00313794A6